MSMTDYPKVLVVSSCAFNKVTGCGVTINTLFQGWPKERIATATNDPVPVTYDVCSNYYFLTDSELKRKFPFNILRKTKNVNTSEKTVEAATMRQRVISSVKRAIINRINVPESGVLSLKLEQWINVFKPDLLYSVSGGLGYIELVTKITERFDIPLVMHFMDDGVTDTYRDGLLKDIPMRNYNAGFIRLLAKSAHRLAICKEMADVYEKRFGNSFDYFQSTVDVAGISKNFKVKINEKEHIRVVYGGSILPFAQLQSLQDCCKAVVELSDEGYSISLHIYSPIDLFRESIKKLFTDHEAVSIHDAVVGDGFLSVLNEADILLLPVNFDKKSTDFIKLSMPTKVPFYLAIGTPVLVYGPPFVAQVMYARDEKWGYVVSQKGVQHIKNALTELINNAELRNTLSQKAREIALKNHSDSEVRLRFQKLIKDCAAGILRCNDSYTKLHSFD